MNYFDKNGTRVTNNKEAQPMHITQEQLENAIDAAIEADIEELRTWLLAFDFKSINDKYSDGFREFIAESDLDHYVIAALYERCETWPLHAAEVAADFIDWRDFNYEKHIRALAEEAKTERLIDEYEARKNQ